MFAENFLQNIPYAGTSLHGIWLQTKFESGLNESVYKLKLQMTNMNDEYRKKIKTNAKDDQNEQLDQFKI